MAPISKRAQEALRVIHALRRSPAPLDLQKKAEASVMKTLSLADIAAVALALDEESKNFGVNRG